MKIDHLESADYLGDDSIRIIVKADANNGIHPHSHEFIELAYVVSGKGTHIINGITETISRGDLILINSSVVHEFAHAQGAVMTIYNYIFSPAMFYPAADNGEDFVEVAYKYLLHTFYSHDNPKTHIRLMGVQSTKIETLLLELFDEYCDKDDGYQQIMKSQMTQLLILIFRKYKRDMDSVKSGAVLKRLMIENTIEYIKINYAEHITAGKLSKRHYISESYFCKTFKEITGMTFLTMLRNIRINVACDLLENTHLSVAEIARKIGYTDLKSFYRLFSDQKGVTPKNYRKNCTGLPH